MLRIEDVTKKELAKVELENAKEAAEEADRLKSIFLANMSHEIRTPLNAIVGFSEIIAETDDFTEKAEYMHIFRNNNQLLLQLINDILDLSKIEAGTFDFRNEAVNVNQMIEELYNIFLPKVLSKGIELKKDCPFPDLLIDADRTRLSQVLSNFMTNAIKFTIKGSIKIGYEKIDNGLRFYVEDTGCGISNQKIDSIFDRFVKLNSFAQGTGLGLSICKMIASRFGGEIGVKSEKDTGSLFWLDLPCKTS